METCEIINALKMCDQTDSDCTQCPFTIASNSCVNLRTIAANKLDKLKNENIMLYRRLESLEHDLSATQAKSPDDKPFLERLNEISDMLYKLYDSSLVSVQGIINVLTDDLNDRIRIQINEEGQ